MDQRELLVTIEFAKTARAEEVWQLVQGGFLKAVSVGFMPDHASSMDIPAGESDGTGDGKI